MEFLLNFVKYNNEKDGEPRIFYYRGGAVAHSLHKQELRHCFTCNKTLFLLFLRTHLDITFKKNPAYATAECVKKF